MIEQRSDDWHSIRRGKLTASRMADVMAKTKTGWGSGRKNYMAELVAERLTGVTAERYVNAAMQHGIDTEADAIAAYEFFTDREVEPIGFVDHPVISMTGASPDGLVGSDGLIEAKCPNTATHIETLLTSTVPKKYLLQMQWQLACTTASWCDFVSFDPRMPEEMQIHIQRIEWNQKLIDELTSAATEFLAELDKKITSLQGKYGPERKAA